MCIQTKRLILGEDTYRIDAGVDTVAERKVNDPILSAEGNGWLCNLLGEDAKPASLTSRQQHRNHFFSYHDTTSCCSILFIIFGLMYGVTIIAHIS